MLLNSDMVSKAKCYLKPKDKIKLAERLEMKTSGVVNALAGTRGINPSEMKIIIDFIDEKKLNFGKLSK